MKNEIKDVRIIYVGIGVFLWLTIGGFSFLIENSIKDLLLNLNVQPIIIIWIKLFVQLISYTFGFILGINIIKSTKKPELIIFRNVIILFILGQILQSTQPILTNLFRTEEYLNNSSDYYDLIQTEPTLNLTIHTLSFLTFVIAGIILYKKR